MENEYYYRQRIKLLMDDFIEKESKDEQNQMGWISDNLAKNMADAAYSVFKQSVETNEFIKQQTGSI